MASPQSIPFCANHPDGTHCYQAALNMVLQGLGAPVMSFDKLDQITGKLEGKWTWPTESFLWLLDKGYEIKLVETFDYQAFGERGKEYLTEKYGWEVGEAQEKNSDLTREQALALTFAKQNLIDFRIPEWKDLQTLLEKKFLLICNVNANAFYNQKGYSGHFIVPLAVTSDTIQIHDPGLPPKPSVSLSKEVFEEAWGYPTKESRNILAIRRAVNPKNKS